MALRSNKKIALIGSSLISAIYASKLQSDYAVTVYEASSLGGAWGAKEFDGVAFPKFNNLICPMGPKEVRLIPDINKFLISAGARAEIKSDRLDLRIDYSPLNYIVGDFFPAIENLYRSDLSIDRSRISVIEIYKDRVIIDKVRYDALLYPANFQVDRLSVDGISVPLEFLNNRSNHVRVFFSEDVIGPDYTEQCDNIFDRAGFLGRRLFIGRVRHEAKHLSLGQIMERSITLRELGNLVRHSEMNHYENQRPTEKSLDILNSRTAKTPAVFLETRQFCHSWTEMGDTLRKIKRYLEF